MSTQEVTRFESGAQRGVVAREEFGSRQVQSNAETALAAVQARERAIVEAHYIMAERHPRKWLDVRGAMLDHCARTGFAERSRYAKPIGKKLINGEWVEDFAKGFTVRFAETLAQEMGNVKPEAAVTYEDDAIRIVRFTVTDLQRNLPRSREVTVAKVVERRGKKDRRTGEWAPPEGREVLSQRINSYGDPVYLCRATDDEMRSKINSEESKTQRDFILKLCPRDILEECEDRIRAVLEAEDKRDPDAAMKKWLDRFRALGVDASDLEAYLAKPTKQWSNKDIQELRELGTAIAEGQATFQDALKAKWAQPADVADESDQEHDARLQRQMRQQTAAAETQEGVAERKIAAAKAAEPPKEEPTEEQLKQWESDALAAEEKQTPAPTAPKTRPVFGRRSQ